MEERDREVSPLNNDLANLLSDVDVAPMNETDYK